jgi:hypothetical protein
LPSRRLDSRWRWRRCMRHRRRHPRLRTHRLRSRLRRSRTYKMRDLRFEGRPLPRLHRHRHEPRQYFQRRRQRRRRSLRPQHRRQRVRRLAARTRRHYVPDGLVQLVGISLNPFEVLPQGSRYGLFHGVWLLCHSWFLGSLAHSKCFPLLVSPIPYRRKAPFCDCGSQPISSQPPSRTDVPNRCLSVECSASHLATPSIGNHSLSRHSHSTPQLSALCASQRTLRLRVIFFGSFDFQPSTLRTQLHPKNAPPTPICNARLNSSFRLQLSTFDFQPPALSSPPNEVTQHPSPKNAKIPPGGDSVSTEAVAARRHAGTHLPVTWWKLEMPTTTWHLLLN